MLMIWLQHWRTYLLYKFSSKYCTTLKNALVWKWISQKLKLCGLGQVRNQCTGLKTLGIHFSRDQEQIIKHNFHERLSEIQKAINLWGLRGLSLFGKVTIIKTFLIPNLLFCFHNIGNSRGIIKLMERMLEKFLCKGPDKVIRLSVINSLRNSGLNLMGLETQIKALRLSWIPRVLD